MKYKQRIIGLMFLVMILLSSPKVAANPNMLSGLEGLFVFLGIVLLAISLIMLFFAFKVKNLFGKSLLALPSVLQVLMFTPVLVAWECSLYSVCLLLLSLGLSVLLIFLYFPTMKKQFKRYISGVLVMVYMVALLFNPAYFGLVEVVPEDNDPFNGKGVQVKGVEDAGFVYTNDGRQYRVDNYLVLEDGRRIPGIFHRTQADDKVLIKSVTSGDYAYEVYGERNIKFRPIKPFFQFPNKPWLQIRQPLSHKTEVIGWGHDFESKP